MKTLYHILFLISAPALLFGQMFTPSASSLPNGQLGQPYAGQVINFTVPQTATISGEVVEQALAIVYPQTQPVLGLLNLSSQTFTLVVERTTLVVQGVPGGMSANCDATPCTYIEGASGYITVEGTPTEAGQFTIDITTLSEGDVDISSITGGILASFGLPTSIDLPAPVPSSLDEEGYSFLIADPNGISNHNSIFSTAVYPNPTSEDATLVVSSLEYGTATLEVYNLMGSLISTESIIVGTGQNQFPLSFSQLPKGLYLLRVSLQGRDTLLRIEKA